MNGGARLAAQTWARHDLHRRWVALIALGVLAGVIAGVAMASLAGARRTSTALARLEQSTGAPDAIVFPSQVNDFSPNFTPLAALPEVKALAKWDLIFGDINGQPDLIFGSDDGTFLGSMDRPIVVKGRMYNPDNPDEVVVDQNAGVPVGTTLTFQGYKPGEADIAGSAPPDGPTVTLHVVGEIREVDEFLFVPDGEGFVSPAFMEQNRSTVLGLPNADVVVRNGEASMPALSRDVNALLAPGVPVLDFHKVSRRVTTTVNVEYVALLLMGLAVAVAGGFLVAQALVRSAAVIGDDAPALTSLGMGREDLAYAGLLPHLLTTAIAAVAAFGVAWALSAAFPVGLGRQLDPNPGLHIDWTVLGIGVAVTVLLVAGGAWLVARRTTRQRAHTGEKSATAEIIRRRAPLTLGIGAGMAFERGPRLPVRPALIGALVGVMGVVATISIDAGIHDALTHPALAGVTWDAQITPTDFTARGVSPQQVAEVRAAAGPGARIAVVDRFVIPVNGVGVPAVDLQAPDGPPLSLAVTAGRAPMAGGEAAIGPETARVLGVHIGDTASLGTTSVRIVGEALFPSDPHSEFDEGIWLTPDEFDKVVPPLGGGISTGNIDRILAVTAPPGESANVLLNHLSKAVGADSVSAPLVPTELTNLQYIRVLPTALAGFLGLVAIAAVSLALVASTRRRQRDFAVLRALGLAPAGARMVLNAQGTAIGVFGLLLGVPLGLAAGRLGWRLVAEHVPLQVSTPLAGIALLALVPATVIVVNLLAVLPGRTVARRAFPVKALRAE